MVQIIVLLSVLSLVSLMAVACGPDEPAPTAVPTATTAPAAPAATEAPEPTAAPPSDGEVFELKYSSQLSPPPFLISEVKKCWADEVARRSNGRIVWTDFYWAAAYR